MMRFITRGPREAEGAPNLGRFQESSKQAPTARWAARCREATGRDGGACRRGRRMGRGRTCHRKPEENVVWRRDTGSGGDPRTREPRHRDLQPAHHGAEGAQKLSRAYRPPARVGSGAERGLAPREALVLRTRGAWGPGNVLVTFSLSQTPVAGTLGAFGSSPRGAPVGRDPIPQEDQGTYCPVGTLLGVDALAGGH